MPYLDHVLDIQQPKTLFIHKNDKKSKNIVDEFANSVSDAIDNT